MGDLLHLLVVALWGLIAYGGPIVAIAFAVVFVALIAGDELDKLRARLRGAR